MKAKIFSFVKVSDDSIVASVRIARFIRDRLGLELCWDESIGDEPLDVLIIINGAYAFAGSGLLESLGSAIYEAKRVVWVQNDYTIIPPKDKSGAESPFRKAFRMRHDRGRAPVDYWTTVKMMSSPGRAPTGHIIGSGSRYINWNALALDEVTYPKEFSERQYDGKMVYYGSYRKDRVRYFERYFANPDVDVMISCPVRKFEDNFNHVRITHWPKITGNLYGFLREFGLGIYLEDKRSHVEFHSPANRFYEMLSAGLPIVFQPEAMKMMNAAGYSISDYVVWSDNLDKLMNDRQAILDQQRSMWFEIALNERLQLGAKVDEAWDGLK